MRAMVGKNLLSTKCFSWPRAMSRAWSTTMLMQKGVVKNLTSVSRPVKGTCLVLSLATATVAKVSPVETRPKDKLYDAEDLLNPNIPLRYDAEKIKRFWDRRPLEVLGRATEIILHLGPFFAKLCFWEMLIRRKILNHEGLQRKYAQKLRLILTDLGPCFIKFGQALSIRPDLLPSVVLFELQKLCDAVPSFPSKLAMNLIRTELQKDPKEIFLDLDEETMPIAAASLGQVYKLRLAKDGSEVAVKVQRPDMLLSILKDLYIMRRLAQLVEKVKTVVTRHRPYDVALLDSFASASILELDYINEATNQSRFRDELMAKMRNQVYIPKVYDDITTRKVLVTEWVQGIQLAKSPPDVINRLIPVGVECFLVQLLETGFFHADPHPGNLLVTKEGKLALIDFGLCANVPLPDTRTMTLAIVHLMQGDIGGLILDSINLGFLPKDVNVEKLQRELQAIYDNAQLAMEEEYRRSVINASTYKAVVTRRKKFIAVSYDLNKIFLKYPFLVPDYFALITRAMIVLEGIAVTGDPEFDLFSSAYPYALRRAISLFGVSNLAEIAREAVIANSRLKSSLNA